MMPLHFIKRSKKKRTSFIDNHTFHKFYLGSALVLILSTQFIVALSSSSFPNSRAAQQNDSTVKMNGNSSFIFRIHNISDSIDDNFQLDDTLLTVLWTSLEGYINRFFNGLDDAHDLSSFSIVKMVLQTQEIEFKVLEVAAILVYQITHASPSTNAPNQTHFFNSEESIEHTICEILNNPYNVTSTFIAELRQQARIIDNSSNFNSNKTNSVLFSAATFFDSVDVMMCFNNDGVYAYQNIKSNATDDAVSKENSEPADNSLFTDDGRLNVLVVVYGVIICMPIVLAVIGLIVLECNLRRRIASGDVVPFTLPSVFDLSLFDEDESTFAVTDIGSDSDDCEESFKMKDSKAHELEFASSDEDGNTGEETAEAEKINAPLEIITSTECTCLDKVGDADQSIDFKNKMNALNKIENLDAVDGISVDDKTPDSNKVFLNEKNEEVCEDNVIIDHKQCLKTEIGT